MLRSAELALAAVKESSCDLAAIVHALAAGVASLAQTFENAGKALDRARQIQQAQVDFYARIDDQFSSFPVEVVDVPELQDQDRAML